jgi:ABC-type transport system involved in cytochrome c biogenesis permease subunit
VAILFLFVQWRYHMSSLSAFIFPLISVASLVATLGNPVNAGTSPVVLNVWLIIHIVFVLLGIAALVVTAVASLLYLAQERELKAKKPRKFYYRLPALGTLDDLIAKSMNIGFVLVTLAVIAASTWASLEMGTAWIRGPRIAISFITWGAYMAMVCLRTTAGWRGRKGAIMAVTVLCFAAITWAAHARLGALLATP